MNRTAGSRNEAATLGRPPRESFSLSVFGHLNRVSWRFRIIALLEVFMTPLECVPSYLAQRMTSFIRAMIKLTNCFCILIETPRTRLRNTRTECPAFPVCKTLVRASKHMIDAFRALHFRLTILGNLIRDKFRWRPRTLGSCPVSQRRSLAAVLKFSQTTLKIVASQGGTSACRSRREATSKFALI